MDRIYLQWNLPNWITVVLMVAIGFTLVGVVAAGVKTATGNTSAQQ